RPRLLSQLKPGARIVSHAFDMGDWQADERIKVADGYIYKWTVPASVAGLWSWTGADGTPCRLELEQTYQQVTGRAWLGEIEVDLLGAELCGERLEIELQANDATPVQRFTLTFADGALKSAVEA
ncbi:MAG: class I SAM-dependent methyltransferase, partial [Bordetella sp.]|nr:class I SAM-dependent methyltransferase [Bordetella sp.]